MCLDCKDHISPEKETRNDTVGGGETSDDQVLELDSALEKAQEDLSACRQKQAYLQADFENFRRNVAKERADWATVAQQNIIRDILPVMDNFERAIVDLEKSEDLDAALVARMQGVRLIYKELLSCFERWQVKVIETNVFNPEFHEAVAKVPAVEGQAIDAIVDVLQKGYQHQGRVIRPARVVVAQ